MSKSNTKQKEVPAVENGDGNVLTEKKQELTVISPSTPVVVDATDQEVAEVIDPEKEARVQREMKEELAREEFIRGKFEMMEEMANRVLYEDCKALIISGPAGIGKTFGIARKLRERDIRVNAREGSISRIASGSVTDIALLGWLHKYRQEGNVLCLDDIDEVFDRTRSLNYLKAACDAFSGRPRQISAGSSKAMKDEDGMFINSPFDFEGGLIFITNVPMALPQNAGIKLAKKHMHLAALKDRCEYIDLMPHDNKYRATRINMVIEDEGVLDQFKFTTEQQEELMTYFFERFDYLESPSLRTLIKIALKVRQYPGFDEDKKMPKWQIQSDKLYLAAPVI